MGFEHAHVYMMNGCTKYKFYSNALIAIPQQSHII